MEFRDKLLYGLSILFSCKSRKLHQIFQLAANSRRSDLYIMQVVSCRFLSLIHSLSSIQHMDLYLVFRWRKLYEIINKKRLRAFALIGKEVARLRVKSTGKDLDVSPILRLSIPAINERAPPTRSARVSAVEPIIGVSMPLSPRIIYE